MMSSSDAIIWNIENDPQLRSTVMAVWVLDEAPTDERMAANIDRMVAAIPRLRQRVLEDRPRPRWDPIDDLDLADHYVTHEMAGATLDDVLAYAETWVREPFDRTRPLWKLGLVTGLEDGKAAIVIKVHHAIADGMGMVLMLGAFTDFERHPERVPTGKAVLELAEPPREAFSPVKRVAYKAGRALSTFAKGPADAVTDLARTVGSAIRLVTPHRTPHSKLMVDRSEQLHMATRSIDLAAFRHRAAAEGVSLNDLFVSIMADALTDYHEEMGVACPRLRVHMPVDIRSGRTANLAGNQFVPARVSLDVRAAPGHTRRAHIAMQLETLRQEPALGHINTVSAAIQRLGKPISRWIIGGMMKGVDVLASNVPGPDFPLFLAGSKIEQFYAFGPPAGASLNATLFSYDGVVSIALTIDAAAITDQTRFGCCLDQVIAEAFPGSPRLASSLNQTLSELTPLQSLHAG